MSSTDDVEIVKTICPMCLKSCGIDAHVKNGKLVKVTPMKEHPFNVLCVKSRALADWVYSRHRVTQPLRNTGSGWKEISWDEAFDHIADRLEYVRAHYGAKSFVAHLGNPFIGNQVPMVAKRFCSLYGTPNYTSGASLCFAAKGIGHGLSLGKRMVPLFPSYSGTRCVVVWGFNPDESDAQQARDARSARKNGAKLIVIDPRAIPLSRDADIYAQIKPGTDTALALGLLNVVIGEKLYDSDFVENWTVGFDELREHVKSYTPEVVERLTWIPADMIRDIARMYAGSKPATITQGVSLDHSTSGVDTSRAISILISITGNLDKYGGNTYSQPLRQASLRVKGNVSVDEAIGAEYPIYGKMTTETTSVPVPDAMVTGNPYTVKALIVQGSNPLLTWPNAKKVIEGLKKLDLLVVSDLFITETARHADIFLPAASFMEEDILKDYTMNGLGQVVLGNKAIDPPAGCLEDWKVWAELGKRMGYGESFPWTTASELFETLLEPSGVTLGQLKENPGGVVFHQIGQQNYLNSGFTTPSGKVEIFSQRMIDSGYDPLPKFEDNVSGTELANDYPFVLISGPRINAYTHSRFRNIDRLRKLSPEPLLEMNRYSAEKEGISDGDTVLVESQMGSIELEATLTEDIHPSVISMQHGWESANCNLLTDDHNRDPVSAYPAFKSVMCRVKKASKASARV